MSAGLAAGLGLALASSLALNTGYLLQHRASAGRPGFEPRHPLASLARLARRADWDAAIALATGGWVVYVAALWLAPLSLVVAFLAGGLALLVPLASLFLSGRPGRAELLATVVAGAALALLAFGGGERGPHREFAGGTLALFCVATVGLAAAASALAARRHLADALGLAAGAGYGLADTCTKALTGVYAGGGVTAIVTSPLAYAFSALTIVAFLLFQRGMEERRPVPTIALMTTAGYAVAMLAGLIVFGDPLGSSAAWRALHVLALATVAATAFVLSSAEARMLSGRVVEQRAKRETWR